MCTFCALSQHFRCLSPVGSICCCEGTPKLKVATIEEVEEIDENRYGGRSKGGRGYGRDSNLKDQQSTGRKRAAILFPISDPDAICEWQGLRFAGGGQFPIVGCFDGKQTHRHHGPNKNTLANDIGNVHRVDVFCHNRWHTLNDPTYSSNGSFHPHDPVTKATIEEQAENEIMWIKRGRLVNAKD